MKNLLCIVLLANGFCAGAQNISFHKDTVLSGNKPYVICKQYHKTPSRYTIYSPDGKQLVELHDGRIDIKGKPGYVLTFLNDRKQCMVAKDTAFPRSLFRQFVQSKVIDGRAIDPRSEQQFVDAHPLPAGYADVEGFRDDPAD
jgi:hypothetical protein